VLDIRSTRVGLTRETDFLRLLKLLSSIYHCKRFRCWWERALMTRPERMGWNLRTEVEDRLRTDRRDFIKFQERPERRTTKFDFRFIGSNTTIQDQFLKSSMWSSHENLQHQWITGIVYSEIDSMSSPRLLDMNITRKRIDLQWNSGDLVHSLRIWWTAICRRNPRSPLEKLSAGVILMHDDLNEA